jgi:UDPglucose--hexose-1-phosphate uridylyltransferase
MSEIRRDRLHDHYVLIAPERMWRPDSLRPKPGATHTQRCPFCPDNEHLTPPQIAAEYGEDGHWQVRVVPNLYKAVQIELEAHSKRDGMFDSQPGVGAHEIVIDTPLHHARFATLEPTQIKLWIKTIASRINDLRHDKRLIHVSVFKNQGESAGATQSHPHTQIIALPVMPHQELRLLERDLQYYRRHGRGKQQDLLDSEKRDGSRIVSQQGIFTAYCPYASSYPFEIIIAPDGPYQSLDQLNRDQMLELATLIREVFVRLDAQLGHFDYNLAWRIAPLNPNFENDPYFNELGKFYRFSLRIMPRLYRLGGFELSTGMIINPVPPEEAAKLLREVAHG